MSTVDSMAWSLGAFTFDGTSRLLLFAPLLASWLSAISTISALIWLSWRAWLVLAKPVEELTSLLGIELPVAPDVVLAGIKADGVILHWKPPDHKGVVAKYLIVVNGITVGEVPPQDTAVTMQGLSPSYNYILRVIALNSISFQAASAPIRLRTRPASSDQFFDPSSQSKSHEDTDEDGYHSIPIVKPYKPLLEVDSPLPTPPLMTREHSGSFGSKATASLQNKRIPRRNSPASLAPELTASANDNASEPTESYQQLSEKVEFLRRETDETEVQIKEESADFDKQLTDMRMQRDQLRNSLKEREDASKELKRQVASLERTNTSAQAKRSTNEKILHQKESERHKMKEDMARWDLEIEAAHRDLERMEHEKETHKRDVERTVTRLKAKHEEEINANRSLEDRIRQRGVQVKDLEEVKINSNGFAEGSPRRATHQTDNEDDDRMWESQFRGLQQEYAKVYSQLTEAQRLNGMVHAQLEELQRRRLSQPQIYSTPTVLEGVPMRMNSQRRRRAGSARNETGSGSSAGFAIAASSSFNNSSISSVSPIYSPYIDMRNGMPLQPLEQRNGLSPADIDQLTAGAPMSPTAGALLPSDLFANDIDPPELPRNMDATLRELPAPREEDRSAKPPSPTAPLQTTPAGGLQQESPGQRPFAPFLAGLGPISSMDIQNSAEQTPGSPSSVQSRPQSIWASPQHSTTNLPFYSPQDGMDSDRRSIRSTSSSLRQMSGNHSSRFSNMFTNRLRGKTTSDKGPPLGALSQVQTRSMPRNETDPELPNPQRRRGSHSGAGTWMNTMSNAFTRSNTTPSTRPEISAPISAAPLSSIPSQPPSGSIATRKRAFNMFNATPWSSNIRPPSPTNSGTGESHGASLPPPTTDGQQRFGWPINQPNSLGADWSMTATNSWSRHPSRRPSLNSSLMPLGHETVMEVDGQEYSVPRPPPAQAPIGTDRPHSSAGPNIDKPSSPPKLNPAAKDFTSVFTKNARGSATEEKAAAKVKAGEQREQKRAEAKERRERKKAEKAEKHAERAAAKAKGKDKSKDDREKESEKPSTDASQLDNRDFFAFSSFGTSPSTSRKSRDTPSITTTDASIHEFRDSLERSDSRTPSENIMLTPLSAVKTKDSDSKETFMQKLTRKSSNTVFNFSSFGNKPGSLFSSRNNTPKLSASEFTDEADEDSGLGSSVGDLSDLRKDKEREKMNKNGGLNWGGLGLRKMSKKDKVTEPDGISGDEGGIGIQM